jgi:hypothetical protein
MRDWLIRRFGKARLIKIPAAIAGSTFMTAPAT